MKRILAPLWALSLLILAQGLGALEAHAGATLLPNGKQQFFSGTGVPLAGGSVYFYVPSTSTPKNTWQNAGQSIVNANPVILDGNGMALIYGLGTYRQVVQDSLGNTIWDQLTNEPAATTDVQSGSIIYGGTSTGAANTYSVTLSPPVSAYSAGQRFQFLAHQTNVGGSVLNVGAGNANIFKLGGSGPTSLTGGEIVLGNVVDVLYDGSEFQLLTQPPPSVANPIPTGAVFPYGGSSAPSGYLLAAGQCVSRTTFSALFAVTGTTYGVCDGSTTFGIPDLRGNVIAGADAMGGTPANRLGSGPTGGITGSAVPGAIGGQQSHTQSIAEMPSHTHSTDVVAGGTALNPGAGPTVTNSPGVTGATGGGAAMNVTQPTLVMNFIIKTAAKPMAPANNNSTLRQRAI